MKSRNLVRSVAHDVAVVGTLIIAVFCWYGLVSAPMDGSKTLLTSVALLWAILATISFVVLVATRKGDGPGKYLAQMLIDAA